MPESEIGKKILRHAKWYLVHQYAQEEMRYNGDSWDPPQDLTLTVLILDNLERGWPIYYKGTGEDLS